jgi:hypothetical protein
MKANLSVLRGAVSAAEVNAPPSHPVEASADRSDMSDCSRFPSGPHGAHARADIDADLTGAALAVARLHLWPGRGLEELQQ